MFQGQDPFSGEWEFNQLLSSLSTPAPQFWSQGIIAGPDGISVHERIVRADGNASTLRVQARFDEKQYPVEGSPIVETIAYRRVNRHTILGRGMKQGNPSITETIVVSSDGKVLTQNFEIYRSGQLVAKGTAVFEKSLSAPD